MRLLILSIISMIAFKLSGAVVDEHRVGNIVNASLKSINEITNTTWLIDGQKYIGNVISIDITDLEEQRVIVYTVEFYENEILKNLQGRINTDKAQEALGRTGVYYSGKTGSYIGLPYDKRSRLLNGTDMIILSDHVGLVNYDAAFTEMKIETYQGISEHNLAIRDSVKSPYAYIKILDVAYTNDDTKIIGRVNTNVSNRFIDKFIVLVDGIAVMTNENGEFNFVTKQREFSIYGEVHQKHAPILKHEIGMINDRIGEYSCEFEIDSDMELTAFCITTEGGVGEMEFTLDNYVIGKNGLVVLEANKNYELVFTVNYSEQMQERYVISIDGVGGVNAKKI